MPLRKTVHDPNDRTYVLLKDRDTTYKILPVEFLIDLIVNYNTSIDNYKKRIVCYIMGILRQAFGYEQNFQLTHFINIALTETAITYIVVNYRNRKVMKSILYFELNSLVAILNSHKRSNENYVFAINLFNHLINNLDNQIIVPFRGYPPLSAVPARASAYPVSVRPSSALPLTAYPVSARPVPTLPLTAYPVSVRAFPTQSRPTVPVSARPAPTQSRPTVPVSARPVPLTTEQRLYKLNAAERNAVSTMIGLRQSKKQRNNGGAKKKTLHKKKPK